MEKRFTALAAVSAAAVIAFTGCSCGSNIENSMDDSDQIMMQSDVTVSSAVQTTTAAATETASAEKTTSAETTDTGTETETTTVTTGTRAIQFVGRSEAQSPSVTRKPQVVTQIVVVTVTVPATSHTTTTTTTTEAVTETTAAPDVPEEEPLYTIAQPDGMFSPEADIRFVQENVELTVGTALPDMSSIAEQVTAGVPEQGGSAANIYTCDGYDVKTEVFTYEDGSTQELVTEIILTGDNVCTTKGVAVGHMTDAIFTAYGFEDWELTETNAYRFQTETGTILEFRTENSVITEIRYVRTSE